MWMDSYVYWTEKHNRIKDVMGDAFFNFNSSFDTTNLKNTFDRMSECHR